jgi:hypothetical protein
MGQVGAVVLMGTGMAAGSPLAVAHRELLCCTVPSEMQAKLAAVSSSSSEESSSDEDEDMGEQQEQQQGQQPASSSGRGSGAAAGAAAAAAAGAKSGDPHYSGCCCCLHGLAGCSLVCCLLLDVTAAIVPLADVAVLMCFLKHPPSCAAGQRQGSSGPRLKTAALQAAARPGSAQKQKAGSSSKRKVVDAQQVDELEAISAIIAGAGGKAGAGITDLAQAVKPQAAKRQQR